VQLRRLIGGILFLSVIGLGISLYLTYMYTTDQVAICFGSGGCEAVQYSPYAWIFGIPIPGLGAAAYVLLILLAAVAGRPGGSQGFWLLALFGVSLIGLLFSAYLTALELFVIHAICIWCVASAVIQLIIFLLALWAVRTQES